MTEVADEARHPRGPGRNWEESYAFDFVATDGSVGGYVRLTFRPAGATVWYWATLVAPGSSDHPPYVLVRETEVPLPPGRSLEVRASGLWADHTCETPLQHWTVGLEAFGVALDDPRDALGAERGHPCPLGFDLEWEASSEPSAARSGYHQPCAVHGEILVGSGAIELDGAGWRSHEWGDHDWWGGDAPARLAGHLYGSDPFASEADVTVEEGLVLEARVASLDQPVTLISHAPLSVPGPGGLVSVLDRCVCRFGSGDGQSGTGWLEVLTTPEQRGTAS